MRRTSYAGEIISRGSLPPGKSSQTKTLDLCSWSLFFIFWSLIVPFGHFCEKRQKCLEFGPFVDCFCDPSILLFALICMLTVVVSSWTACCSLSRLLSLSVYLSAAACCTATSDSRLHRRSLGPSTSSISRTSSISETEFYEQDETAFAGSMIRWDNYTTHTHKHEMRISITWTEDVFLLSEFLQFFSMGLSLVTCFFFSSIHARFVSPSLVVHLWWNSSCPPPWNIFFWNFFRIFFFFTIVIYSHLCSHYCSLGIIPLGWMRPIANGGAVRMNNVVLSRRIQKACHLRRTRLHRRATLANHRRTYIRVCTVRNYRARARRSVSRSRPWLTLRWVQSTDYSLGKCFLFLSFFSGNKKANLAPQVSHIEVEQELVTLPPVKAAVDSHPFQLLIVPSASRLGAVRRGNNHGKLLTCPVSLWSFWHGRLQQIMMWILYFPLY